MSKLSAASLFLALAACGGGAKSSTMPTAAAGPSCTDVAAQIITAMAKAVPDLTPAQLDKLRPAVADQCTKDAWSAEARTCFSTITDTPAADQCATKLTQAQKDAFGARRGAEVQATMGATSDDDAGMSAPKGGGEGGSVGADPCDGGE